MPTNNLGLEINKEPDSCFKKYIQRQQRTMKYNKHDSIRLIMLANPLTSAARECSSKQPLAKDNGNGDGNKRTTTTRLLSSKCSSTNTSPFSSPSPFSFSSPLFLSLHLTTVISSIAFIMVLVIVNASPTHQQSSLFCPRMCTCDEQNLVTECKGSIGASGLPHTLNPNTRRMFMNYAQTSQLLGIDYLSNLETLDLAYNKISVIDFTEITKNTKLIMLNTSHNNVMELKDTLVANALAELGSTQSPLTIDEARDSNEFEVLKKLTKINVAEFNLSHNNLTILRNYTFIRWHKLQRLDLSYNTITDLWAQAFFGLNKLEFLNLRGNRLLKVPTLALHSTIRSLSYPDSQFRSSSLKFLDLSENKVTAIGPESFSLLEKAQEIYLESCSLEFIHEQAFKGLHTLNLLSLDKNNLQEVPIRSFTYLGLLRSLRISANNITNVPPESFSNLENLEELQINYGSFNELQLGVFNGLCKLKRLEAAYNSNLTKIEAGTFDQLSKLTYLSLHSDSLASIPTGFNANSHPLLQILDLRDNPLYCGCELKWLTKWLKKFTETVVNSVGAPTRTYSNQSPASDETQVLLMDSLLTIEIANLTCAGPPALAGKRVIELPEGRLECLEPSSDLNVHLGFVALFFIAFAMTLVCMISFCRNKRHLFVMIKKNLVQNHISMMLPYTQNLHKNVDDLKKETQLYGSDYEPIDYNQQAQVYTVNGSGGSQAMYYEPQQYSQHI